MKKDHSIFKSFGFAFEGISAAFIKGRNFRIQTTAFFLAVFLGLLLQISFFEWAVIVLAASLVLILELINTAIEIAVDLASPEIKEEAKTAKDVAAGAVLISSIASVLVALFIFLPKVI